MRGYFPSDIINRINFCRLDNFVERKIPNLEYINYEDLFIKVKRIYIENLLNIKELLNYQLRPAPIFLAKVKLSDKINVLWYFVFEREYQNNNLYTPNILIEEVESDVIKQLDPSIYNIVIIFVPLLLYKKMSEELLYRIQNKSLRELSILAYLILPYLYEKEAQILKEHLDSLRKLTRKIEIKYVDNEIAAIEQVTKDLLLKYLYFLKLNEKFLKKYYKTKLKSIKGLRTPSSWFEELLKILFVRKFFPIDLLDQSLLENLIKRKTGGPYRPDFIYVKYKKKENELWIWIVDAKHWEEDFCKSLGKGRESYDKYYRYYREGICWKRKILEKLKQKNLNIRIGLLFITKEKPKSDCKEKLQVLEKIYERAKIISLEEAVNLLI